MARRRFLQSREGIRGEEEKWISYADLLSALVLIFALFLIFTLLNQKSVDDRSKILSQKEAQMQETRKNIEATIGVKQQLIQELVKAFKDSNLDLQVDPQTGAITFSGGVFFASGSSDVTPEGRAYLAKFIPKYISILMSDQFRPHMAQIIVEGHTDHDGTYMYNLQLSQDRAFSVVQTIFSDGFPPVPHSEDLKSIITANGRSFSVPVLNKDGTINAEKSRRVEFKFRLKDDEMLNQIQQMVVQGK